MPRILPISTNDRNNDKSISLGNRRIGFFDGVFCRFQRKAKGRSRISRERNTSNIAPDINRSPVLSCVRMIRKLRLPDYSPEDLWTLPPARRALSMLMLHHHFHRAISNLFRRPYPGLFNNRSPLLSRRWRTDRFGEKLLCEYYLSCSSSPLWFLNQLCVCLVPSCSERVILRIH